MHIASNSRVMEFPVAHFKDMVEIAWNFELARRKIKFQHIVASSCSDARVTTLYTALEYYL